MQEIVHYYGADLDWVEDFAKKFDGHIDGNFIIIPDEQHVGFHYVLEVLPGVIAMYIDSVCHKTMLLRQQNLTDDFIGIYYDITEEESELISEDVSKAVGRWHCNLVTLDSSLKTDFVIKKNSHVHAICIFIKKNKFKNYVNEVYPKQVITDHFFDSQKNTIIRYDRMDNNSIKLIQDLKNIKVGGVFFDFIFKGTVFALLSYYIDILVFDKVIIEKVFATDFSAIITSQTFLAQNAENSFPGIELLSQKALMSESKYKKLFKKVTGLTPHAFFQENKLQLAKQILETRKKTVFEVSNQLNFVNSSYFSKQFKKHFEMSPKDYINKLQ